ncbi:MAG TPA: hypothetical protein VFC86_07705 [Planctomycetota bacterium]|nr:hypothetical protein [Planctomycetota bacterium]
MVAFALLENPVVKTWGRGMLVAAWAALVAGGVWLLAAYANAPGPSTGAASEWAAGGALGRDPVRPTLLMFLHPLCPCSRASVEELNTLLARAPVKPAVKAVFIRPAGAADGWERQGLWRSAADIPGVETLADPEGAEALRFGIRTSGHVLLYAPGGALLFSGGITSARGHSGDNAGLDRVLERLRDPSLPPAVGPVFGCLLFSASCVEDHP